MAAKTTTRTTITTPARSSHVPVSLSPFLPFTKTHTHTHSQSHTHTFSHTYTQTQALIHEQHFVIWTNWTKGYAILIYAFWNHYCYYYFSYYYILSFINVIHTTRRAREESRQDEQALAYTHSHTLTLKYKNCTNSKSVRVCVHVCVCVCLCVPYFS